MFGSSFAIQRREDEIVSNQKLLCFGEETSSSAHTAHHARRGSLKLNR